MIEGTEDDESPHAEVELHPLLHSRDNDPEGQENPVPARHPTRIVLVKNPNQTINVGISPSPAHLLQPVGGAERTNPPHLTMQQQSRYNRQQIQTIVPLAAPPPGTGVATGAGVGWGAGVEMGGLQR